MFSKFFQKLFFFLILISFSCGYSNVKGVEEKSFDQLLCEQPLSKKDLSPQDLDQLNFYRAGYQKSCTYLSEPSNKTRIPKVLHFIWIGPKSFPIESIKNLVSWKKYHPDWVMKFWTDSKDRICPIDGMERHLVSQAPNKYVSHFVELTPNYGEKSDLLRYEILFHEGGVYVDHDVECFQSFDKLNQAYDFYACLEAPHSIPELSLKIAPNNGLVGSKAGHPILQSTMEYVQKIWIPVQNEYPGSDYDSVIARVMKRTFDAFGKGIKVGMHKEGNRDIIFPSCFFLPDQGFSEEAIKLLKTEGLVYSSHKLAGTWHGADKAHMDIEKVKAHLLKDFKKTKIKIIKKVDKLLLLSLITCFVTLLLLAFMINERRGHKSR
jgi:hypothetical protein